jgi:hypothetical protein
MAHRLKTPEGRKLYAQRKHTAEPVFGIIKSVLGFRQFLLRGLDKVRGEWNLVTLAGDPGVEPEADVCPGPGEMRLGSPRFGPDRILMHAQRCATG